LTTVQRDNVSRHAQAKTNASCTAIVSGVKSMERFEYRLQFVLRYSYPLISYLD
jgi:hypothetical protein